MFQSKPRAARSHHEGPKSLPYVFEQLSPAKSSPSLSEHHHHPAPWWKASMDNLRTGQEFFPPRYREDDIWDRRRH